LIKIIMPTTPLRNLSEGMPDYWDVNPPNTESSKENHPCRGEEKTALLERRKLKSSINTLLGNWPTKVFQQQTC
jgi:hypothetical protein